MGSHTYSMYKDPEFPVVVENTLTRKILVSWVLPSGKKYTKVIVPTKKGEITTFERLGVDAQVRFEVYGTFLGWTATPIEVDKAELLKQAYKAGIGDDEALCITVSQSTLFLRVVFSNIPWKKNGLEPNSLLKYFPVFDSYPELRKILSEEKILGFVSYKACLYSQDDGTLMATAEDIYRYILSVEHDYDQTALKNALSLVKERWQKDVRSSDKKKKQRAQRIVALAQKAFKGLDQALYERKQDGPRP